MNQNRWSRWKPAGLLVCVLLSSLPSLSRAYHLPLWELGVGLGGLNLPAYRGAKGRGSYLIPFPYIIYRGDAIRMDEDGMRGRIFEGERVKLDLSLAGNIPVPEESGGAREGMPDLDPVGEFGPSLDITLWHEGRRFKGEANVWLKLPLRIAMSVGDPLLASQGWFFSPYLDLSYQKGDPHSYWKTSLALGPLYGSRRYHEYFYKVSEKYETPDRKAYQPEGGYSGSRVTVTVTINSKRWFFGAFMRFDQLKGAVFDDSPLVETNQYHAIGFAISRVFAASPEGAPH